MSDPKPTPGPATEAMRLRPRATTPAARALADAIDRQGRLEVQLGELVDGLTRLHRPLELDAGTLCRECLTPHPCRTLRLAHPGTGTDTPREEESP